MEEVIKSVIPSLVEEGFFGDVKFVDLNGEDGTDIGAQFSSTVAFVNLTVRGLSGEELIPLVVKLTFSDLERREMNHSVDKFYNEVSMYKKILPGLGVDENRYPKMFYGKATAGAEPDRDLLVLENLNKKNFVLSKERVYLDLDHISLVVKKIAEFHSFSYKLKHDNKERFFQMTKLLKSIILNAEAEEETTAIRLASIKRGMKPLLDNNKEVDVIEKCLNYLKCPTVTQELLTQPEEPFAVICHGDFCNNNVLFKYDQSGRPVDCAFFDFQTSSYTSPAIDLFFFLYMHTTTEMRLKHWDDFIKIYWDTLRNSIPDHIEIPSFQEYLKHFAERAIYGYTLASWFNPILTTDDPMTIEDFMKLNLEEKSNFFSTVGGEESDEVVSSIFEHLLNEKYINAFLEFCDANNIQC